MKLNELRNAVNSAYNRLNAFMSYKIGDDVRVNIKTNIGWLISNAKVVAINYEVGTIAVRLNCDKSIHIIIDDEFIKKV